MDAIYRLVNRNDNKIVQYCGDRGAQSIGAHLLGRRISAYMVIKSDQNGDRVVSLTSPDVTVIIFNLLSA